MGRFLNADALTSTGQGVLGYNMFAYCGNNPVVYSDETGAIRKPTVVCYNDGGGAFDKEAYDLEQDRKNYNYNNADPGLVFDSTYFSSYKGAYVIRHGDDYLTSWAFGGTIYLNHNLDSYFDRENMLNHEYGHFCQEMEMSTPKYFIAVFLPSTIYNYFSRSSKALNDNYYNMPWEYDADMRGGVDRSHASWAQIVSDIYFALWGVA